jgi:signal transduction histidine kinase
MASTLGTSGPLVVHLTIGPISTLGLTDTTRRPPYIRQVQAVSRLNRRDVLVPAGIAVVGVVELVTLRFEGWGWGVLLELVACALLVGRRVHPLIFATAPEMVLLLMPYFGPQLDEPSTPILVLAVAIYSLGRWLHDNRGLGGIAVILLMVLIVYLGADGREHDLSDVVFVLALVTPPYVLGRLTRRLAIQKELLEERQELVRREAVRQERDRIARDMHDVIAHSISAMVVQTAAAQDLVRTDPDRAEAVLADVADTGRQAIAETGRLLHVLRDDQDELGLEPAPGLADLPGLVAAFRASGLDIDVEVAEDLPSLPAGVDVSAYRIVQEALTNALRYGSDRTARLRVVATSAEVSIEASNPSSGTGGSGAGLGLVGVSERVALLGGRLTHGVRDGRFELHARLPLVTP